MAADYAALSPAKPKSHWAIFWGGLIAGILDITAASTTTWWLGGSPIRMLQGIASGVIGAAALEGGLASAALGLGLHFFIATTATTVFYLASRKLKFMVERAIISGLLYGVAVFLFMYLVVLPLTFHRNPLTSVTGVVRGIIIHMLCVGLPIALVVRRFSK